MWLFPYICAYVQLFSKVLPKEIVNIYFPVFILPDTEKYKIKTKTFATNHVIQFTVIVGKLIHAVLPAALQCRPVQCLKHLLFDILIRLFYNNFTNTFQSNVPYGHGILLIFLTPCLNICRSLQTFD